MRIIVFWVCIRVPLFWEITIYELRTKVRLGGTYRGLYTVLGGDVLRDILQIQSRALITLEVRAQNLWAYSPFSGILLTLKVTHSI